ncbi:uncharacterized protein LOC132134509 [Carassius carassius]|uniref:uncharacterized protein LOC132134509 n=1 Tax=Carassius carassius TaxID=217509 RepID=UPI002868E3FD|nr:uncharacterized protein LOC132134509 [Carassius carassius]
MQVVESVKHLAGYDSKTHAYRCPSLALKIGHNLTKISMLLESHANQQNDYSAAKDARTFRRVYETRWNELISAASLRTLQESKWNTPLLLPFTKDVQTLHSYLDVQQQDLHSKLSTEVSPQMWAKLAKVILAQVILFNRRRAGEVSKMTLSAYVCQNPSDPHEDVNEALSDLEKKLCQHFSRIEIRGKRGRKVPVLLTPVMKQGLDLLVGTRQECEVPRENVYLFARPSALTCYRGSDCLRHFAKVCGAKSPESLTSTKLRKQTGTVSQVLNLSNTELDQLADFLGHDVRVHRQFYRLPEGTLQLAKISKVLMALDQGRLAEFKGKTLDDINIDPEENVLLDSERESESESQVTTTPREENDTAVPDVSESKSQKRDKDDIKEGEEIAYDYGGEDYPWRTQITSVAIKTSAASASDPSLQSETQMDDESAQINSPQQMKDSGELFDSTPDYVPDTTSDSDVSLTLNPTKRQLLDELDIDESGSASSPDCDTTTSDKMHSLASEASGTGEEPSSKPSAEVALPPTEGNDMPPPPKRPRPPSDEEMPTGASAVRPSSKGKSSQKKTPWQQTEVQAVERHMKRFITSLTVPAKSDCDKCLKAEPEALKNRNWKTESCDETSVAVTECSVDPSTSVKEKRDACEVDRDNPFLFGRPKCSPTSFFRGQDCIRLFANEIDLDLDEEVVSDDDNEESEPVSGVRGSKEGMELTQDETESSNGIL